MATEEAGKRTLVTEFGELKEAMLVVMTPCRVCSGEHQFLLVDFVPNGVGHCLNGDLERLDLFECEPRPRCLRGNRRFGISAEQVRDRLIYRIDTGIDLAEDAFDAELDRVASEMNARAHAILQRRDALQEKKPC